MRIKSTLRMLTLIILAFAPLTLKLFVYRKFFGWEIAQGASIGISIITAHDVRLGSSARIGNFNVIRNLPNLHLGHNSSIGRWNWITCGEFFTNGSAMLPPPRQQGLFIGPHTSLTSRHYLDCPGGVTIGAFTTVAGVRSTLLTHFIDVEINAQRCRPVTIGDYCYIGSNAKFTPGATVPDRCVVGMGAVVVGDLCQPNMLYAGVPAKPIRPVMGEYFDREVGRSR